MRHCFGLDYLELDSESSQAHDGTHLDDHNFLSSISYRRFFYLDIIGGRKKKLLVDNSKTSFH